MVKYKAYLIESGYASNQNVESVGKQLGVKSDVQVFTHVKCLKKTRCLEVLRQGKGLNMGEIHYHK